MQPRAAALALLSLALAATGCRGPRNFENENDRLRAENQQLRDKAQALEQKLESKRQRIERLERARAEGLADWLAPDHVPQLEAIRLGGLTGVTRAVRDGEAERVLRVYVRTLDQQERFLPVAARLTLRLVNIPQKGEPKTLITRRHEPEALDEAYRSNLTGTHYSLALPIPEDAPKEATLKAVLVDGRTGREFTAQKAVKLGKKGT